MSVQTIDPIATQSLTDINHQITVNGQLLSEETILQEMQHHPAENQRDAMIKASEALIINELLKQRCEQLGIEVSADDNNDDHIEKLIAQEIDYPQASDEDCQQYYQANPNKFVTSPLLAVKHILLAADPEDTKARIKTVDQAKQIIAELQKQPEVFEQLAEQYSKCPSAKTGGQLGQISKGQTVAEFEKQLFNCEEGLIEQPIESRYGVHVAVIDHRENGKALPFELVADRIATYLNEKVKRKAIAQYIEQLVSESDIQGFEFDISGSPLMQ